MKHVYYLIQVDNAGFYRPGTGEEFTNKRDAIKERNLKNKFSDGGFIIVTVRPSWDRPINPEFIVK